MVNPVPKLLLNQDRKSVFRFTRGYDPLVRPALPYRPTVSVIVPVYNCPAEVLEEAVQSARSQCYPIAEILLIDDGSADPAVASRVAKKYRKVRLIRHDINRGGGDARNTGIQHAVGELIAFLDADDLWLPGKLRAQIAILKRQAGKCGDANVFVASNCLLECGEKRWPSNTLAPDPHQPLWRYFIDHKCALQTSTLIVPAAMAKAVRFRPGLQRHQDWDFVIRLEEAGGQLAYIDDCLSVYRLRNDFNRISKHRHAANNSMSWLEQMTHAIPRPVMQRYFFRQVVRGAGFRSPLSMVKALARAILLSPETALQNIFGACRARLRR